jgi:hypothetical protein
MSAPTPWQSGTAHSVGDVVQAFTDPGTGFFFRCTVAGTTGSAEPFWPSIIGNDTVEMAPSHGRRYQSSLATSKRQTLAPLLNCLSCNYLLISTALMTSTVSMLAPT